MSATAHYPEDSRFRVGLLLSRTIAECEDFGARCEYSPRIMIVTAAFAAVRLCHPRSGSERLQPFPPQSIASPPQPKRRKTDRAEVDPLQENCQNAPEAWFFLKRVLLSIVRLPT